MGLEVFPEAQFLPRDYLLDGTSNQVDTPRHEYDATLLTGYPRSFIYCIDGVWDEKWGDLRLICKALR